MKNTFYLLIGLVFLVGCFYLFLDQPAPERFQPKEAPVVEEVTYRNASIDGVHIKLEVRDTPEGRTQGLSGRESLEEGTGMLFVFDEPNLYGFWMKDMKFTIDIIWINKDFRVVGVERNISPESFPNSYSPKEPVLYVLEVPAGYALKAGIDTGSTLSLED